MTKLLKYIEPVRANNGKIYFYFRRKGKRIALPGAYNSPEFLQAYWALRNGNAAKVEIAVERTLPGSVNAAVVAYYKHHSFTKNKPITQQTDRNILEAFRAKHGDKRIALLQQNHIEAMIGEKAGKPSAQRNLLKALRLLLDIAVKNKMRRDNPARSIKLDPIKTSGYHSWSEAEVRQYEQHHPIGSKPRLALGAVMIEHEMRTDDDPECDVVPFCLEQKYAQYVKERDTWDVFEKISRTLLQQMTEALKSDDVWEPIRVMARTERLIRLYVVWDDRWLPPLHRQLQSTLHAAHRVARRVFIRQALTGSKDELPPDAKIKKFDGPEAEEDRRAVERHLTEGARLFEGLHQQFKAG